VRLLAVEDPTYGGKGIKLKDGLRPQNPSRGQGARKR